MLKWEESEVTEFFGGAPEMESNGDAFTFSFAKNGVRIAVTIVPSFEEVWMALFRDGWERPIYSTLMGNCTMAQIRKRQNGVRFFEAEGPKSQTQASSSDTVRGNRIRVFLEPQIRFETV